VGVPPAAGIGFGAEDAFAVVVQRVVEPSQHAHRIAEGRMGGHILDALAIDPDLAPVPQALDIFLPGIRLGPDCARRFSDRSGSLGFLVAQQNILQTKSSLAVSDQHLARGARLWLAAERLLLHLTRRR